MSLLISTNRGGRCGLCLEDFKIGERQLNHRPLPPHRPHDGFHPKCLQELYHGNPIRFVCPYDQSPLDPTSLVSRRERIFAILKPAFVNGAYATVLGGAAGLAGAGLGLASAAAGLAGAEIVAVGAILGLAGAALGLAGAAVGLAGAEIVALGAAGAAIVGAAGRMVGGAAAAVEAAAVGVAAGAAGAGLGINLILGRLGVDRVAHENILWGIYAGALASAMALPDIAGTTVPPLAALLAGVAAGVFSLIRR